MDNIRYDGTNFGRYGFEIDGRGLASLPKGDFYLVEIEITAGQHPRGIGRRPR